MGKSRGNLKGRDKMEVIFEIKPENYTGYDNGVAVVHIKGSELTPKVKSFIEESIGKIDISTGKIDEYYNKLK